MEITVQKIRNQDTDHHFPSMFGPVGYYRSYHDNGDMVHGMIPIESVFMYELACFADLWGTT